MPPTASQYADIQRTLGEVQGGVKAILRELDNLRDERRVDMDNLNDRIQRVEGDVSIVGKAVAQSRDLANAAQSEAAELKEQINTEIKPQTDKLKAFGLKGLGFVAGVSFFAAISANPALATVVSLIEKLTK